MVVVESLEVEYLLRGTVVVAYLIEGGVNTERREAWDMTRLRQAMPFRPVATHVCYNEPKLKPLVTLMLAVMGAQNRMRVRQHVGTFS